MNFNIFLIDYDLFQITMSKTPFIQPHRKSVTNHAWHLSISSYPYCHYFGQVMIISHWINFTATRPLLPQKHHSHTTTACNLPSSFPKLCGFVKIPYSSSLLEFYTFNSFYLECSFLFSLINSYLFFESHLRCEFQCEVFLGTQEEIMCLFCGLPCPFELRTIITLIILHFNCIFTYCLS